MPLEFCPGLLNLSGAGLEALLFELESLEARVHWIEIKEGKIVLMRLQDATRDLRAIADQMLASGIQDLARDVVVFFSEDAERSFLRPPEATTSL